MAHGAPDNFNVQPKSTVYRLEDMAELAVRLGAPNSVDRLGDVIFLDSFENGLGKWETFPGGVATAVTISSKYYRTGGFSAKLYAQHTESDYAEIISSQSYPELSKMGLELSFSFNPNLASIYIKFIVRSKPTINTSSIYYKRATDSLYYLNSLNRWILITDDTGFYNAWENFCTLKLVADFINSNYVRVRSNSKSHSLADIPLKTDTDSYNPFLIADITIYNNEGVSSAVYIDDIIITQNEP